MLTGLLKMAIGAMLISVVTISCSSSAAKDPTKSAELTAAKLPVDVKVVKAESVDEQELIAGSLVPNREVLVMSEVTKKISSILFRDGSYVTRGQVLYKLDNADIRARMNQLTADLSLAKINERRMHELLKTETVRQEEYDVAYTKLKTLQASQNVFQVELSKTSIRAPFSGKIGISKMQVGALVSPGIELVNIQEQGSVKVQFSISEKYLPVIRTGAKIQFSTELNEALNSATVIATEPGVDVESRNITVQAIAINPGGVLKPGMSVKVHFNTTTSANTAFLVPTEALIPNGKGYSVYLVKQGTAKMTPVGIGNRNEAEAAITSGLSTGDTVMVSNILRAMDGTPVQVVSTK
jgi:membrane fusion protein (multidrug efflux system)